MSDNTQLGAAVGVGDVVRDKDRSGTKTPIVGIDTNIGGASEVLQTASALADATANPTVPLWGSCLLGFNGTTWDRLRSSTANGLVVDVSRIQGTTAFNLSQYAGIAVGAGNALHVQPGTAAVFAVSQSGTWNITVNQPLPAGTNNIGQVSLAPQTSGGLTPFKRLSTADTNLAVVKNSAGQLYDIAVGNTASSPRYLKIYDKATAPVLASDVPKFTFMIPSPGTANGGGLAKEFVNGVAFANGIAMALTTGAADADTGAVGANELTVNLAIR